MNAMRSVLAAVPLVVVVANSGCASRQKQNGGPIVLVAPPYDSTKRDPAAVIFRNVFTPGDSAFVNW